MSTTIPQSTENPPPPPAQQPQQSQMNGQIPAMPQPPMPPQMPVMPPMQMPLSSNSQNSNQNQSNKPNQTLYINNLNYKFDPDMIRKTLLSLFHSCGQIKQILVGKKYALKGQAWVVFTDVEDARKAMEQFQGCNVLNRPIFIQYAKEKSDIVAREEGTFVMRPKKNIPPPPKPGQEPQPGQLQRRIPAPLNPANNTLLCLNIPENIGAEVLQALFSQCVGFKEVRPVPGRNVAFIEYISIPCAQSALRTFKNYKLTENYTLELNYAKPTVSYLTIGGICQYVGYEQNQLASILHSVYPISLNWNEYFQFTLLNTIFSLQSCMKCYLSLFHALNSPCTYNDFYTFILYLNGPLDNDEEKELFENFNIKIDFTSFEPIPMSEVMEIIKDNPKPFEPIIKLRKQCSNFLMEKNQCVDILYRNDNIYYINCYRLKHEGKFPRVQGCYDAFKSLFGNNYNRLEYDFELTAIDGNLSEETLVNHMMGIFSSSLVNGMHSTTYHCNDEEECYTVQIPENPKQEFSIMDWPTSSENNNGSSYTTSNNNNNDSPNTPVTPSIMPSSSSINSNSITISPLRVKHKNMNICANGINNNNKDNLTHFVLSPIASPIPVSRKAFLLSSITSDEDLNNNNNRQAYFRQDYPRNNSFDPTTEQLPNYVDL